MNPMRLLAATITALLIASGTAQAVHTPPKVPHRDEIAAPTYNYDMLVRNAAGSIDGTGSWAWAFIGYHPNGWHVYAEAPSRDAAVIRSLVPGDTVTLSGVIAGVFKVRGPNYDLSSGDLTLEATYSGGFVDVKASCTPAPTEYPC